ncbi:MAG: type II toxin-antitoxin system VapC family toxin [Burkholderiales bacterium]|nr:type II toxin-antitoxin system VapC family toxin [Burkholderiales bacterium]
MPFVLDSSAALARAAPDETLPQEVRRRIETDTPVAPALWPFETVNGLEIMRRRGRLDSEALADALDALRLLPIEIEPPDFERNAGAILPLARQYGLTVYDAAYLEIAKRRRLPIATLDDGLRRAAKKARVKVL